MTATITVTTDTLRRIGACDEQVELFGAIYPNGVTVDAQELGYMLGNQPGAWVCDEHPGCAQFSLDDEMLGCGAHGAWVDLDVWWFVDCLVEWCYEDDGDDDLTDRVDQARDAFKQHHQGIGPFHLALAEVAIAKMGRLIEAGHLPSMVRA